MKLRWLGQSGMRVSPLCLGAMSFGSMGNTDHEDCAAIIHRALDSGINFIDTADVYSRGESEVIVGKALKGRREDVVLASKFYNKMSREANHGGASRRWIVRACEDSLRRLDTDYLDLYQVHRPDEHTDIEETLGALTDLVQQGKVRVIGSSTYPAERIVEAQWASSRMGLSRFRCEQPPYSIFVRGIERDVLPTCQRYGMGAIVWSPLNGGWLTGKYQNPDATAADSRFVRVGRGPWSQSAPGSEQKLAAVEKLQAIASDAGTDLITLSIAFTLAHPAVSASIIGPRTMGQLESQLDGGTFELDTATLDAIDQVVAPGETITRDDVSYEPAEIREAELRRFV